MVTQVSAERIGHLIRNIDHLPSNANHRDLVRFDHPQDDRYVSMIEKLKEMAAKAPSALPSPTQISYSEGEAQARRLLRTRAHDYLLSTD